MIGEEIVGKVVDLSGRPLGDAEMSARDLARKAGRQRHIPGDNVAGYVAALCHMVERLQETVKAHRTEIEQLKEALEEVRHGH
jgi:hypothetical protein